MDIKRMHDMIEKLSECAKMEFDKGIENVDTCEMSKVVDMMKDLAEAMYYRTLTKVMENSDDEEILEMFDRYNDDRRFYDNYRYANGRFAPKGRGTYRRGYKEFPEEIPYIMTPEMYRKHDPEYYRDMDKIDRGRMYYTEPTIHDVKDGKSWLSRKTYMETKEMHKGNTPEDKQHKMRELEKYMNELSGDIVEMIADATPEEKSILKSKLQTLTTKIN